MHEEQLVDVKIAGSDDLHRLKFTFSILNNNPENQTDLAYVIVFRKAKK